MIEDLKKVEIEMKFLFIAGETLISTTTSKFEDYIKREYEDIEKR